MIARFKCNRVSVEPISSSLVQVEVETEARCLLDSCTPSEMGEACLAHEDGVFQIMAPLISRYFQPLDVFSKEEIENCAKSLGLINEG